MAESSNFPIPLIGSVVRWAFSTNLRAVRVDDQGRLDVVIGGGATVDVNLQQVAGTATVEGGVSGSLGVGGLAAQDAAAAGNPNAIGLEAADFDGAAFPNTVDTEGDIIRPKASLSGVQYNMLVNEDGSATPQAPEGTAAGEGIQISLDDGTDTVFAQGDTSGNLQIVGPVQDDVAAGSDAPVKGAAVADQVPSSVTDGDLVHLIADLERYLRIRDKAYDALTASNKVAVQNTIASDRDTAAQVLCDVSNIAAATVNYPSDAGVEIGNRTFLSFILSLNDITSVAFEVSNDGTTWVDASEPLVDDSTGQNGYAATHWTAGVGNVDFGADWEKCGFRYIRLAVTFPNNTNTAEITLIARAN